MHTPFTKKILNWYEENARELPWRGYSDPYAIWVSEIMLQQTRTQTVIPYFTRWMENYPSAVKLAEASQQDVLHLWEGLGYYSRARNLHKAAQIIIKEHNGKLPSKVSELCELPGIGPYTGAAIASIAFGADEVALDGNIRRVLSRVFNITDLAGSAPGEKTLMMMAKENLPSGKAGTYNQAVMDLGSLICTHKSPDCINCPVMEFCQAKELGVQENRPVPKEKQAIPHHTVTAAVFLQDERVLIAQRPQDGLLGGMWEFPGGKVEPLEDLAACLQREIVEELGVRINVGDLLGVYRHAYTHFRVTLHAFYCTLNGNQPKLNEHDDIRWVALKELADYPMGKIDRQIANQLVINTSLSG